LATCTVHKSNDSGAVDPNTWSLHRLGLAYRGLIRRIDKEMFEVQIAAAQGVNHATSRKPAQAVPRTQEWERSIRGPPGER